MSMFERVSLSGMGYDGETPYYTIWIDYGMAFQSGADAFMADATSSCPIDTGFLLSTIGASADSEGCDMWADAEYAVYVDAWSSFFTSAYETAIAVIDATCNAIYVDTMLEEYDMILVERDEVLLEAQMAIDEKQGEIDNKEEEKKETEEELVEVEREMEEEEEEGEGEEGDEGEVSGSGGGGGGGGRSLGAAIGAFLAELLIKIIEIIIEELLKFEEEKTSYQGNYDALEDFYNDLLSHY